MGVARTALNGNRNGGKLGLAATTRIVATALGERADSQLDGYRTGSLPKSERQRLARCETRHERQEGSPEKSLLRRLGDPIPQRLKIFLMQRYSPQVLIKINGIAQAQFCFLYAPCHTRATREFEKD